MVGEEHEIGIQITLNELDLLRKCLLAHIYRCEISGCKGISSLDRGALSKQITDGKTLLQKLVAG